MKTTEKSDLKNSHLYSMGWNSHFQSELKQNFQEGLTPARVTGVRKNLFFTGNGKDEWTASPAGRLRHDPDALYPVTGDWVLVRDGMITRVLRRRNALSRGASGSRGRTNASPMKEQVIAANLDTVFIVSGLDRDFNLRRIERCLTLVYNCGLTPVIILTKADLQDDPEDFADRVAPLAFGVPVHLIAAGDDAGLAALAPYLAPGLTTAMLGSSGAGKSTLINRLSGKTVQLTGRVSDHDGKGKHTTTSRDLVTLPSGGMVIDNPGIREIALWENEAGMSPAFPEIEEMALACRFSDCSHTGEPGCRVLEALENGELSLERLENYRKMKRELDYLALSREKSADRVEKERWKGVALKIKAMKKRR